MDDTDELLKAALAHLKTEAGRGSPYSVHLRHFSGENRLSLNTIKHLVEAGSTRGKTYKTKEALLEYYKKATSPADTVEEPAPEAGANQSLYFVLKDLFGCGDQSRLASKYEGNYTCFRFQSGKSVLIEGKIRIFHDAQTNSYSFEHTSDDAGLDLAPPHLVHSGPFFVLENRAYLVGVGQDAYGAYLRPIIVKAVTNPSKIPLPGVVLTEWINGNVPVAARTILYRDELLATMQANANGPEGFKAHVTKELQAAAKTEGESVACTNLLGW